MEIEYKKFENIHEKDRCINEIRFFLKEIQTKLNYGIPLLSMRDHLLMMLNNGLASVFSALDLSSFHYSLMLEKKAKFYREKAGLKF